MARHIPRKDELLTVIFQKEIDAFFKNKKRQLGFDFFGMAERSSYGSMFASSDPGIALLLYDNGWYACDPAINRDILKTNTKGIIEDSNQNLYQNIITAKKEQCDQAGNFTIPVILGETELYFCIAAKSTEKLALLKHRSQSELSNIGIEFRGFMHALAAPPFDENRKFRDSYCYYISNNTAYEGKETFLATNNASRYVEIARFNQRATQLFRITSDYFVGFTSDLLHARQEKLTGKLVEELPIIESSLFHHFENSIFYSGELNKHSDIYHHSVREFLHKDTKYYQCE